MTEQAQRPMTPIEALQILDAATTPANAGKLNRADYINIQTALEVLAKAISPPRELNGNAIDVPTLAR